MRVEEEKVNFDDLERKMLGRMQGVARFDYNVGGKSSN